MVGYFCSKKCVPHLVVVGVSNIIIDAFKILTCCISVRVINTSHPRCYANPTCNHEAMNSCIKMRSVSVGKEAARDLQRQILAGRGMPLAFKRVGLWVQTHTDDKGTQMNM